MALSAAWRGYAAAAALAALAAIGVHVAGVQALPGGALLLAVLVAARAARLVRRPAAEAS